MTTRDLAIKSIGDMPESATWADIEERIRFLAAIDTLDDIGNLQGHDSLRFRAPPTVLRVVIFLQEIRGLGLESRQGFLPCSHLFLRSLFFAEIRIRIGQPRDHSRPPLLKLFLKIGSATGSIAHQIGRFADVLREIV